MHVMLPEATATEESASQLVLRVGVFPNGCESGVEGGIDIPMQSLRSQCGCTVHRERAWHLGEALSTAVP